MPNDEQPMDFLMPSVAHYQSWHGEDGKWFAIDFDLANGERFRVALPPDELPRFREQIDKAITILAERRASMP